MKKSLNILTAILMVFMVWAQIVATHHISAHGFGEEAVHGNNHDSHHHHHHEDNNNNKSSNGSCDICLVTHSMAFGLVDDVSAIPYTEYLKRDVFYNQNKSFIPNIDFRYYSRGPPSFYI